MQLLSKQARKLMGRLPNLRPFSVFNRTTPVKDYFQPTSFHPYFLMHCIILIPGEPPFLCSREIDRIRGNALPLNS